jgi:hypothetical protein
MKTTQNLNQDIRSQGRDLNWDLTNKKQDCNPSTAMFGLWSWGSVIKN